jgi:hypothetical protein
MRQYCGIQLSASLRGWCVISLAEIDTVFSVDAVYLSISRAVCSLGDLMRENNREVVSPVGFNGVWCSQTGAVWRNTGAVHDFITSCQVLAQSASRHSSRLLCWFRLPNNIGCGLNSILYVPPTAEQLRGISSVAAEEEHERGDSSYHKYQLMSLIRKEYRASKVTLANGEVGPNPAHFDVYHLVTGFAGMMALSQNAAYRDLDSDALLSLDSASLVDEPQPTVGQGYPIQEGTNFNTTDEADYSQVPTSYPQMATITSAQQNRLLSLLEQSLPILTPNNPNSASFTNAEFTPFSFSAWYSQKWKVSYEHEALCKLHTAYNYPGRFGTKGRCFYKLENYIADRCIPKIHYFWTRRREKVARKFGGVLSRY